MGLQGETHNFAICKAVRILASGTDSSLKLLFLDSWGEFYYILCLAPCTDMEGSF
jgi:hypothetical protein